MNVLALFGIGPFLLCGTCQQDKQVGDFARRRGGRYGRAAVCRECQRAYYATNAETIKARSRRWHADNGEQSKATHRAKYLKDRVRINQRNAAYKKAHPDAVRASANNRRAIMRSAPGRITKPLVATIRKEQSDTCVYCPAVLNGKGQLDHRTPLSRGGSNYRENLQLLCQPCNGSKGAQTHEEFLRAA